MAYKDWQQLGRFGTLYNKAMSYKGPPILLAQLSHVTSPNTVLVKTSHALLPYPCQLITTCLLIIMGGVLVLEPHFHLRLKETRFEETLFLLQNIVPEMGRKNISEDTTWGLPHWQLKSIPRTHVHLDAFEASLHLCTQSSPQHDCRLLTLRWWQAQHIQSAFESWGLSVLVQK